MGVAGSVAFIGVKTQPTGLKPQQSKNSSAGRSDTRLTRQINNLGGVGGWAANPHGGRSAPPLFALWWPKSTKCGRGAAVPPTLHQGQMLDEEVAGVAMRAGRSAANV